MSARFHVDPSYARPAHAEVVGAFAIAVPPHTHLVTAWSPGFLPVTLEFSDRRCFSFTADYLGGTLSNGQLSPVSCLDRRAAAEAPAPPPPDRAMRLIGSSWGYNAWSKPGSDMTIVTAPFAKTWKPLLAAQMRVIAIMAMNGPDWPGGNVTLVGTVDGRLMVVTLDVGW